MLIACGVVELPAFANVLACVCAFAARCEREKAAALVEIASCVRACHAQIAMGVRDERAWAYPCYAKIYRDAIFANRTAGLFLV
ncbi:MAG: hypothetical protein Q4D34_03550 [Eggerthellaceae bacterium]|nr:hypothetical protein [Eggerthellaceae bacterium]